MTRRSCLGAAILLATAIGGCSSATTSRPLSSPSPGVSPSPSPSPTEHSAQLQSPSPTPRCHTAELQVGLLQITGAAGQSIADLEFRSTAPGPCYVYGYVGMAMLDSAGRRLTTNLVRDQVTTVSSVILAPGSPALGAGSSGHARFSFQWVSNCDISGSHVTPIVPSSLEITPPDETGSLTISARPASGPDMSVCPAQEPPGTVHTKPVGG
jgi:hypothetical protein